MLIEAPATAADSLGAKLNHLARGG